MDTLHVVLENSHGVDTLIRGSSDFVHFKIIGSSSKVDSKFYDEILKNGLTILIALIAGVIALIQVKSNIVASSRIRWIEDLKESISEIYPVAMDIIFYYSESDKLANEKSEDRSQSAYEKYEVLHSRFNSLTNKVRMNLNPKESEHIQLEDSINQIDNMLDSDNISRYTQVQVEEELKKIILISRKIFKKEWDKAKRVFKI